MSTEAATATSDREPTSAGDPARGRGSGGEDPVWRLIADELGPLVAERQPPAIRAWVPGCGAGADAFHLADLAAHLVDGRIEGVKVYATEADPRALALTRQARTAWARRSAAGTRVVLGQHDVARDAVLAHQDVISARGLVARHLGDVDEVTPAGDRAPGAGAGAGDDGDLEGAALPELLERLASALVPGGLLLAPEGTVGSESSRFLEPVQGSSTLFRRRADARTARWAVAPARHRPPGSPTQERDRPDDAATAALLEQADAELTRSNGRLAEAVEALQAAGEDLEIAHEELAATAEQIEQLHAELAAAEEELERSTGLLQLQAEQLGALRGGVDLLLDALPGPAAVVLATEVITNTAARHAWPSLAEVGGVAGAEPGGEAEQATDPDAGSGEPEAVELGPDADDDEAAPAVRVLLGADVLDRLAPEA